MCREAPPAFTAPIRKPANFGSRCRLAAPLRRAMRADRGSSGGSPIPSPRAILFAGSRPCRRTPSRGRARASFPRCRRAVCGTDRRPPWPLAGDDQGVLLRPHRREGAGGQGPLRRRVPGLRRLHPAAQRQGRRLRLLQALSSRRDPAEVDAGAGDLGDAGVARTLRPAAVVLRLVADARGAARGKGARAARTRRLARGERCHAPVRCLERRAGGGRRGEDEGAGVGGFVIWQGIDLPAETPGIDRYIRGFERR
jgi:hypothetical protein